MKKTLIILLFVLHLPVYLFSLEDIENTFYLKLEKKGVNALWFSDTAEDDRIGNLYPVHNFPIASGNIINSKIYLKWKISSDNAKIDIKFVSSSDNQDSGYMLEATTIYNKDEKLVRNFQVVATLSKNDAGEVIIEPSIITPEKVGSETDINPPPKSLEERTISLTTGSKREGTVELDMTVLPIYTQFMEAQYVGYIIAELSVNS